jgi:hypothetical protein
MCAESALSAVDVALCGEVTRLCLLPFRAVPTIRSTTEQRRRWAAPRALPSASARRAVGHEGGDGGGDVDIVAPLLACLQHPLLAAL